MINKENSLLPEHLYYLKLICVLDQHGDLVQEASKKQSSQLDYLEKLTEGETALRQDRCTQQRIRMAHFPVIKTLDQFNWS